MSHACCPFCYEGEIVEDNDINNHFFCSRCLRKVEIRKKKHSFAKHL